MKSSYIIIVVVVLILGTFFLASVTLPMWNSTLVSPLTKVFKPKVVIVPGPSATFSPSPKPKTFQFNSSTDLKSELDSIDPEILDSDFLE